MYRLPEEYEKIKKTVVDIYVDYNITGLPIYEKEICRKLKVLFMSTQNSAKRYSKIRPLNF